MPNYTLKMLGLASLLSATAAAQPADVSVSTNVRLASVTTAQARVAMVQTTPTTVQGRGVVAGEILTATRLVEDYFNGITTLQAGFTQTQSDKPREVSRGTFYVSRPGKFLWQYEAPVKQKIVGTGTAVYYVDQSAKLGDGQVTQLPVDAGLGRLLRGHGLRLSKVGLKVTGVSTTNSTRIIRMEAGAVGKEQQGLKNVTLRFTNTTLPELQGFAATDMLNVTTDVTLTDVQRGGRLNSALFRYTPGVYQRRN